MANTPARIAASGPKLVAVLDLPQGSLLILDGAEIQIQRNDFIGFTTFPDHVPFHWLTVRPASHNSQSQATSYSSIAAGFLIPSNQNNLIRQYDPQTEEVSSKDVDETTKSNLLLQLDERSIQPTRLLTYQQILSTERKRNSWQKATSYISERLLKQRRIEPDKKIIPGSFDNDEEKEIPKSNHDIQPNKENKIVDGDPVFFPRDIPVLDSSSRTAHRITSHSGTKRFLSGLNASQRTSIAMEDFPGDMALQIILHEKYRNDWKDMIGDVQLSFLLFLQLNCFNSLEHWRDLVAMLSYGSTQVMSQQEPLYQALLATLEFQLHAMESEFFEDQELSGDNFLRPALQNLMLNLNNISRDRLPLQNALQSFEAVARDRIPSLFDQEESFVPGDESMDMASEDDDGDGPIIVDMEEVNQAMIRSKSAESQILRSGVKQSYSPHIADTYPLLFAAILPHEDIVMTCARALDDARDVSLVREAAAYLEEVESKR